MISSSFREVVFFEYQGLRAAVNFLFNQMKETPLHARVPGNLVTRGSWANLVFDVVDILAGCFPGSRCDFTLMSPFHFWCTYYHQHGDAGCHLSIDSN